MTCEMQSVLCERSYPCPGLGCGPFWCQRAGHALYRVQGERSSLMACWVFRTNVTADSGIVTGIPVKVTGAIAANVTDPQVTTPDRRYTTPVRCCA